MKLAIVKCLGGCLQISYIFADRFDKEGLHGVYLCPTCGNKDVANLIIPRELSSGPNTKFMETLKELEIFNIKQTAGLAEQSRWRQKVPVGQLSSSGLRDDKPGQGAPKESKQSSNMQQLSVGAEPPRKIENRKEEYEKAECRALGLAPS